MMNGSIWPVTIPPQDKSSPLVPGVGIVWGGPVVGVRGGANKK